MGLFDVFSKGGKYFGKAIEPKCEYCEHGKRSSDGNKVLCTRKGMVDAGYHCPKFLYSPLKRIPVKQLERVGLLEGDYDEVAEKPKKAEESKPAAPAASAPKPAAPAASAPKPVTPPPAPKAPAAGNDLAALAAAAEAAPEYTPEVPAAEQSEEKPAENAAPDASVPPTLSSM